jgi:hypothetical protein
MDETAKGLRTIAFIAPYRCITLLTQVEELIPLVQQSHDERRAKLAVATKKISARLGISLHT